jgi:hypothetical protein
LPLCRIAGVFAVGGADQGEVVQVRNGENDALVFVLQDVRVLAFVQLRHDQVAALDQADAVGRFHLQVVADELGDPWPAAFTSALARIENRLPSARSRFRCHRPLARRALTQRVWV